MSIVNLHKDFDPKIAETGYFTEKPARAYVKGRPIIPHSFGFVKHYFFVKLYKKTSEAKPEDFCPFCFTGRQLMASLPPTATEGGSGTPPVGWGR